MSGFARAGRVVTVGAVASVLAVALAFDWTNGTGFVGKGDVMTALGISGNANAPENPSFSVEMVYEFGQTCEKTIEQKKETKVMSHTYRHTTGISSSVQHDTRKNKNNVITGYTLLGYNSSFQLPTDICPANESGWTPVTALSADLVGGTLKVNGETLSSY